jgi:hypothetical protein
LGFKRKETSNQSNKDKGKGHNNAAGTRSAEQQPPAGGGAEAKAEDAVDAAGGQGHPGSTASATTEKMQESLELLKQFLPKEVLADITLSLQKQKENDEAQRAAGTQQLQDGATPPPESVPTPTSLVSKWTALSRLSRTVDRRQKSVEKAQAELAKTEAALMAATEANQKAQEWLLQRKKALSDAQEMLAEAEVEAKTAPSMLPSKVAEAPTTGEVSAMLAMGELLLQGKPAPATCPEFIHKVVCSFINMYGEDKFLRNPAPDADMQHSDDEAPSADDQVTVQPELAPPGVDTKGGGAAEGSAEAVLPVGREALRGSGPATPPLRPDNKKPRMGGTPLGEAAALPTAIPAFNGGAGLGRGLFEAAPLTAANLAGLPGHAKGAKEEGETVRSRTRSRASSPAPSSKSAPLPTELGQEEAREEAEEEAK